MRYGHTSGRIGTHMVSGSSGRDPPMSTRSRERGRPCLWRLYGGTSSEWSYTITIVLASTSRHMPSLLRASHRIGCVSIGSSGTPETDAQNVYEGSRSRSSMHGLHCACARPAAHLNQTCSTGFAHADNRSTTRTCCASTSSRLSLFPVLIGGRMSFDAIQHRSMTYANCFQSICEKQLPALLLWAHDIGLDKCLLRHSVPHVLLRRNFW